MNTEYSKAIQRIRRTLMETWRQGWGRETEMSPNEIKVMDDFIEEAADESVRAWIKIEVAKALGIEAYLTKEDE